jgi:YD repeat-containing protein
MKYLYIPLVLLLLTSCADEKKANPKPEHSKTDWAFYKLNGEVQSVAQKSMNIADGKTVPGYEVSSEHDTDMTFDDYGKLIHIKQWLKENMPYEETTYNGKDRILKRTQYMGGTPMMITEHQWDASGENLTSIIRRNPDNSQIDHIQNRYEKGKIIEKLTLNAQDTPTDKITYEYDNNGNLVVENLYLGVNAIKVTAKYGYNDKKQKVTEARYNLGRINYLTNIEYEGDKVTKKESLDSVGKPEYTELFKYDAAGNIAKHVTIERYDNSETDENFVYDKNKNVTLWTINKKGAPLVTITKTYDKQGNLVSSKTVQGENTVLDAHNYEYTYDKNNNWTSKKIFIKGEPAFLVERKITYHTDPK